MSVVTSIITSNPYTTDVVAGSFNPDTKKVNDYYYGRAFSRGARGFVGFETMTVVDRDTELETQRVYRQDFPFNGQAYIEQVRTTSGRILSTRYTDYGLNRPSNGAAPYFPYQIYRKQNITASHDLLDGSLLKVESTSISRADLTAEGFVKKRTATLSGQDNESQTVVTDVTYKNINACNVRGAMSSETITSTRVVPGQTNRTSVLTKDYRYYEDNADPKGRCGLIREEITQPDTVNQITTETEYSLLGNPEKVTRSAENSVPSVVARITRRDYDPLGRFAVATFDAYDHKIETVNAYNDWGLASNISDANGFTRTIQFDVFNRIIVESANDGSWNSSGMQPCQNISCPVGAITRSEARLAGGAYAYEYRDILGRVIRRANVGFDGRLIFVDTEYDSRGNVKLQSEPYYSGDNSSWNRYNYDRLGRDTSTYLADGSISFTKHRGLDITKTNALEQTRQENYNALGELDEVIDHNGGRITSEYDALGNLVKATTHPTESDLDDVVITMGYDDLSRKLWMNDPDKGYWSYSYNGFGELYQQTNANLATQTHSYDNNGRLLSRTDRRADGTVDSHTRWYFDGELPSGSTVSDAIGHTSAVVHSLNANVETCNTLSTQVCEIYNFDSLGRGVGMTRTLGANGQDGEYNTSLEYDTNGRVLKELDVVMSVNIESGVYHHYNQYGYDYALSDIGTGVPNNGNDGYEGVYEVLSMNARGQVTKSIRANGVTSDYSYNPENGRIEKQIANVTALFPVQDITYTWDAIGNLKTRRNYSGRTTKFSTANAIEETFCYDDLNRVTDIHRGTLNGNCAAESYYYHHTFNSLGNITYKRDVGSYIYGQNNAGPHAVTTTSGRVSGSYTYDKNGNLIGDSTGRAVKYTAFDKPYEIIKSGEHTTTIYYGPNRERWKRIDKRKNGVDVTTLYFGSVERITKSNTDTITWKRYLGSFAFYTIETDSSGALTSVDRAYIYKDYQGSTDVITNAAGTVTATMGFDVWGKRRDAYKGNSLTGEDAYKFVNQLVLAREYIQDFTTQGYTGHEHLDEVGLIHMNGRVYDPTLGRFMSADILVDNAMDSQGYNRYSYVKNRPMFYTDPSGFESELCDGPEAAEGCGGEITTEVMSEPDQTDPCGTGICSFITVGLHNEFPSDSGGVFGFSSSPDNISLGAFNSEAIGIERTSRESFGLCDFSLEGGCTTISFTSGASPRDVFKQIHDSLLSEYLDRRQAAWERGELFDENNGTLGTVTVIDVVLPELKALKVFKGLTVTKNANKLCFVEGTLVHTQDGLIPIEEIQVGDLVASKNDVTGETDWKRVSQLFINHDKVVFDVTVIIDNGEKETLGATYEHPFWVEGKGWVKVGELASGDYVHLREGELGSISEVKVRKGQHTTYNFEVEDFHTYFVGERGVWVHNTCGGVAKGASGSVNNATKPLLNRQLSAEQIAKGHAFEKHVLQQGQFPFIKTKKQFADHLESVMANPTHHKKLGAGREAFYDSKTSTFIVRNPRDPDGGSAFQESLDYFNRQN